MTPEQEAALQRLKEVVSIPDMVPSPALLRADLALILPLVRPDAPPL